MTSEHHGAAPAPSHFAQGILDLLRRTEYRRVDSGEDLEDIYRLRYRSYRLNDLVPANPEHRVHDPLDETTNVMKFGVYIDENLVSTIRLHHVHAGERSSPAMSVFGDVLRPRLDAGQSFIDPSRFAVDTGWSVIFPQIPYLTLRLAGMACVHFNAPFCISMIREDHAAFYKRIYKSHQVGEPRNYGGVIKCDALLYEADVLGIMEESYRRYPFFRSRASERRLLFDRPSLGINAPMTVIPSAQLDSLVA